MIVKSALRNGGHAIVRTSRDLKLELVRPTRSMHLVLKFHRQVMHHVEGVDVRHSHRAGPTHAVGVLNADPDPPRSKPASIKSLKQGWRWSVVVRANDIAPWSHACWLTRSRVFPRHRRFPPLRGSVKPPCRMIDTHRMEGFDIRNLSGTSVYRPMTPEP